MRKKEILLKENRPSNEELESGDDEESDDDEDAKLIKAANVTVVGATSSENGYFAGGLKKGGVGF